MEEGKGERYLASGRQYSNALLGVRHQEEEELSNTADQSNHTVLVTYISASLRCKFLVHVS